MAHHLEVAMHDPAPPARRVRFGAFELDLRAGELRRGTTRLKVPDQSIEILKALLEQPGELVTREALRERLWPSNHLVDFEHGLNAAVRRLREGLDDSAETAKYVETLPRRGYRFIGVIDEGEAGAPPTARAERMSPSAVGADPSMLRANTSPGDPSTSSVAYAFGPFRLDLRQRWLLRGGKQVSLPPKAVDLLLVLVRHAGQLVTKEQLLNEIWPGTFVEEGNLSYTVSLARKALGDDAEPYRFIETVPKRGYRFIGSVHHLPQDGDAIAGDRTTAERPWPWNRFGESSVRVAEMPGWRRMALSAFALIVFLGLCWSVLQSRHRSPSATAPDPASIAVLPLRNLTGDPAQDWCQVWRSEGRLGSCKASGNNCWRKLSERQRDTCCCECNGPTTHDALLSRSSRVAAAVGIGDGLRGSPVGCSKFSPGFVEEGMMNSGEVEGTAAAGLAIPVVNPTGGIWLLESVRR